jgi:hypothetical protein
MELIVFLSHNAKNKKTMKRTFTTLFLLLAGMMFTYAQTLVTTQPTNKNVILENYTGIHCQYCPDGDVIAQAIQDNNPGRVTIVDVHQGTYAVPNAGEPDYRTPFGDALEAQTGLTGYPMGTVNRHLFPGNSGTALNRGDWTSSSSTIMGMGSPVNVGITSQIDTVTRELIVHVELYYTANSATSTNYINVALLQDSVHGPQTNGGAGNNYNHMHMLRYLVTGQWGDAVTPTTAGTLVERTYNYTIPDSYNNVPCVLKHCRISAFVTESHQEILSGDNVSGIDGTNLWIGDFSTGDSIYKLGHPYNTTSFNLQANSNIAGTEQFKIKLTSDAPANWDASFVIDAQTVTDSIIVDLVKGTPKAILLNVLPGTASGFQTFTFAMTSITNPNAPVKYFKVYVLSNVNTLLVNAAGDNNAKSFQQVYLDGLDAAGSDMHAVMMSDQFVKATSAGILSELNNIFYNVAWTFPAFTDPEALAAKAFINRGGHFFVAGQDIGWDIESNASGSHGTPEAKDLYENYLKASWIADGGTTNNKLVANTTDSLYGTVVLGTIHNVFGGSNMYPDQIAPTLNATTCFYYDAAKTKISGIRSLTNSSKVVYFGFGIEMVLEPAIANDVIDRTWHYFMDIPVGIQPVNTQNSGYLGQNFPNPAGDQTTILLNGIDHQMTLELVNMTGSVVSTSTLNNGTTSLTLSTASLPAGLYLYRLIDNGREVGSKRMQIIH